MWLVGVRAKALADCWYAKGYKIQGFKGTTAGSWLLAQIGPRDSRFKDSKRWLLAVGYWHRLGRRTQDSMDISIYLILLIGCNCIIQSINT